jgi:hypothetical protein
MGGDEEKKKKRKEDVKKDTSVLAYIVSGLLVVVVHFLKNGILKRKLILRIIRKQKFNIYHAEVNLVHPEFSHTVKKFKKKKKKKMCEK